MNTSLILILVAIYFSIGAAFAAIISLISAGLGGKWDPVSLAFLFAWPIALCFAIPPLGLLALIIAFVGSMTWIASLIVG